MPPKKRKTGFALSSPLQDIIDSQVEEIALLKRESEHLLLKYQRILSEKGQELSVLSQKYQEKNQETKVKIHEQEHESRNQILQLKETICQQDTRIKQLEFKLNEAINEKKKEAELRKEAENFAVKTSHELANLRNKKQENNLFQIQSFENKGFTSQRGGRYTENYKSFVCCLVKLGCSCVMVGKIIELSAKVFGIEIEGNIASVAQHVSYVIYGSLLLDLHTLEIWKNNAAALLHDASTKGGTKYQGLLLNTEKTDTPLLLDISTTKGGTDKFVDSVMETRAYFNYLADLAGLKDVTDDIFETIMATVSDHANDAIAFADSLAKKLAGGNDIKKLIALGCAMHKVAIASRWVAEAIDADTRTLDISDVKKGKSRWEDYKDPVYTTIKNGYYFLKNSKLEWLLSYTSVAMVKPTNIRFLTYDKNALKIILRLTDILNFLKDRTDETAVDLRKNLQDPHIIGKLWILAMIYMKVTIPYLILLRENPGNIDFNTKLAANFPKFRQAIQEPKEFLFNGAIIFTQSIDVKQGNPPKPDSLQGMDDWLVSLMMKCLTQYYAVLERHTKAFLPDGEMMKLLPEEKEILNAIGKSTSNSCESLMGLIGYIKKTSPNSSPGFITAKSKLIVNNYTLETSRYLTSKYVQILPTLSKMANERKSWTKEQMELIRLAKEEEKKQQIENENRGKEKKEMIMQEQLRLRAISFRWDISMSLKKEQLKDQCKKHAIKISGNKSDLVERLKSHFHPYLQDTCSCLFNSLLELCPIVYKDVASIFTWDLETDHVGNIMEIALKEWISNKEFSSLVKVPVRKRENKIKYKYIGHKLTYEEADHAHVPEFKGVWEQIILWMDTMSQKSNRLLICHSEFDISKLKKYFDTLPSDFQYGNSVWLSKLLRPDLKSHNLDTLITEYKIQIAPENRHRALGDSVALMEIIQKMATDRSKDPIGFLFAFFTNKWFQ